MPDDFTNALIERLRASRRVRIVGAGTKPALSRVPDGAEELNLSGYRGMVEYEPSEFTFTARAGTRLEEIMSELARYGQYLPFDPPLAQDGGTLGGTVAAGLNGPGRLRFGGMRDFILGVRFMTGDGRLIRGGGKVVKNAAGFDFPKLLVGSCGRLGVLLEITFKVFPAPQHTLTAEMHTASLETALQLAGKLTRIPFDLEALEILSDGTLVIRLAGDTGTLEARLARLNLEHRLTFCQSSPDCWARWSREKWVKVPLTPARISSLDAALNRLGVNRRYGVAGNVAWIEQATPEVDSVLAALELAGLALAGPRARLGAWPLRSAEDLVSRVLDPDERLSARY
ncbi:MAG: FAD-binding protein [Verrucomicrobiales bacterium]